jgi:hypothetical protein
MMALQLAGHPMHRPLLAARDYFGDQVKEFQNFLLRFWALMGLIETNILCDWVREALEKGGTELHPSVIYACAEVRLTENGLLPVETLLQKTQQIANEEFHDLKW